MGADPGFPGAQHASEPDEVWDDYGYLKKPRPGSIGICCSGGGIRSASFSLGALQVLREGHWMEDADYLACVSGGGYISIAHAIMTSQTVVEAAPPSFTAPLDPETVIFGELPPWAPGSPEEQHLRDRLSYLAPGLTGKAWALLNLGYGLVKTLLPFVAVLYAFGCLTGIALSRWLGPALRWPHATSGPDPWPRVYTAPFAWVGVVLLGVAALVLFARRWRATRPGADGWMFSLQYLALSAVALAGGVFLFLVLLPISLHWLHGGWLGDLKLPGAGALLTAAGGVAGAVSYLGKIERSKWFARGLNVLATLSAPILILVPFVGFTYWNAQWGSESHALPQRMILLAVAVVVLVADAFIDQVTPIAHLFYRDRLATAFVGYRAPDPEHPELMRFRQPPWEKPLRASTLRLGSSANAKIPELVVCAAVDLSSDVPVGRLAAPFTFERDWAGSPVTGYVPTPWLEEAAPTEATLPAMMAISGAAVAPSMGKMTRPALRFLMTILDVRLGVWLPNPFHQDPSIRRSASDRLHGVTAPPSAGPPEPSRRIKTRVETRWRRPGSLYLFREAFGMNGLSNPFVYVSDGGHWENLGLVELLRRGCTDIVCIDGSGGDAISLGTLSQAIALARSDLGIEIEFDSGVLESLKPGDDGFSESGFAVGTITFPETDHPGRLLYVRTVIPADAPQDVRTYRARDHRFPNHSTADQFFTDATFEAYRALGRHNTQAAIDGVEVGPPTMALEDAP